MWNWHWFDTGSKLQSCAPYTHISGESMIKNKITLILRSRHIQPMVVPIRSVWLFEIILSVLCYSSLQSTLYSVHIALWAMQCLMFSRYPPTNIVLVDHARIISLLVSFRRIFRCAWVLASFAGLPIVLCCRCYCCYDYYYYYYCFSIIVSCLFSRLRKAISLFFAHSVKVSCPFSYFSFHFVHRAFDFSDDVVVVASSSFIHSCVRDSIFRTQFIRTCSFVFMCSIVYV